MSTLDAAPPLSAARLNPLIAQLTEWAIAERDRLYRAYYASGNPPGTEPLPPAEVYRRLVTLRDAGDPLYWSQPEAEQELTRLSKWYGPPPSFKPPSVPPMALPQLAMGGING